MKMTITTENSIYILIINEDKAILCGGRIRESHGVAGKFLEAPTVGARPLFFTQEPVSMIYNDGHIAHIPAESVIKLSTVISIEVD